MLESTYHELYITNFMKQDALWIVIYFKHDNGYILFVFVYEYVLVIAHYISFNFITYI